MAEQPPTQKCENCRYLFTSANDSDRRGCRRYPPTAPDDDGVMRANPTVSLNAWCGEWAPAKPETVEEGAATMARLVLLGDLTAARALADKLRE